MFYIIIDDFKKEVELLEKASKSLCEYKIINSFDFDYTQINFGEKDSFYKVSTSRNAGLIEKYLMEKKLKNFRKYEINGRHYSPNHFEMIKLYNENNVPFAPTIPFTTINQNVLKHYVSILGGFPIIIKEFGDSSGNNILKVDSMSSLISCLNYTLRKSTSNVHLKKFIDHDEQARLIVLGDKVIASKVNKKISDDIRLNNDFVFEQEPKILSDELNDIAVKATNLMNREFAGVDILLGKDGQNYVAEINTPCAFSYTQKITGVNIANQIVEYLNSPA